MTIHRTILIEAANGYIGYAVAKAYSRAGWRVFGLVRRPEAATMLLAAEIIPIISTLPSLAFLEDLYKQTDKKVDVIAVCAAPSDYATYFERTLAMLQDIAKLSTGAGVKPLVLWTSGSKDYGQTKFDGDADLAPHTEEFPLDPLFFVAPRMKYSLKVLDYPDLFDATILRPTNVIGYSSSILGCLFEFAEIAAKSGRASLQLDINPRSIMHILHVDDCGEAYLALAQHNDRGAVAGQCFNISAARYETARSVLQALASEYEIPGGSEFVSSVQKGSPGDVSSLRGLFGYSQWCSSDKIRALTGWNDVKISFTENIHGYRLAYESAVKLGDEDVARNKSRIIALDSITGGFLGRPQEMDKHAELC